LLLELTQKRRILFFGGKGGVGKTTVSAATALAAANGGKKVLLVSTDPAHNLGHLFDRRIGSKPVKIAAGLDVLELDPVETVKLHMKEVSSALHQLMPVAQHAEIDKHIGLSKDAPGMQEAAMLEKIAEVVETGTKDYDLVIFDTAPSGHTARLMVLPEMMSAWTEGLIRHREKADKFADVVKNLTRDSSVEDKIFGDPQKPEQAKESRIRQILLRRKTKFATLRDKLADKDMTSFIIVLAAERLPVLETIELHAQLERGGINVDGLVINKRAPDDASTFMQERRQQEQAHMATLIKALPNIPRQDLMLIAQDIVGVAALERFSKAL
jgi:arsenite-transporting ATPase